MTKVRQSTKSAMFHSRNFKSTPSHRVLLTACRTMMLRRHFRDMSKVVCQVSVEYRCLSEGNSNPLEWPGYAILVSMLPGTGSLGHSTSDLRSFSFHHICVFTTQVILLLCCVISSVLVLRVRYSVCTRLLACRADSLFTSCAIVDVLLAVSHHLQVHRAEY